MRGYGSRLEQLLGLPYGGVVTVDLSQAAQNTIAEHRQLSISGLVELAVLVRVTENFAAGGGGTLALGWTGVLNGFKQATLFGNWLAANPLVQPRVNQVAAEAFADAIGARGPAVANGDVLHIIADGAQVTGFGHTIAAAAFTNGTYELYYAWRPLSAGASVTPAAGGTPI